MACFTRGDLQTYLDGEIVAQRRDEIEKHLTDCRACQAELARLERNIKSLDAALAILDAAQSHTRHVPASAWPTRRLTDRVALPVPLQALIAATIVVLAIVVVARPWRPFATRVPAKATGEQTMTIAIYDGSTDSEHIFIMGKNHQSITIEIDVNQ